VVITDGLRRRDLTFGTIHDNKSQTLTADAPLDTTGPAHDYLPTWGDKQLTVARYQGVTDLRASSSDSQPFVLSGARPEHQPWAALDGDVTTSWEPDPTLLPTGQWLELDLERPQPVTSVHLVYDPAAGALPTSVTVATDDEAVTAQGFGISLDIPLKGLHPTRQIRITVNSVIMVGGRTSGTFAFSEVDIPGLDSSRTLVSPAPPATDRPATISVQASPSTPACFFVSDRPYCDPDLARGSEDGTSLDRTVTLPASGDYTPQIWARPRPGPALDDVLDRQIAAQNPLHIVPTVTASSVNVLDPAVRPGAVLDGDPYTAWIAADDDPNPIMRVTFLTPRTVAGIQLITPPDMAVTRPGIVQVIGDGGVRGGLLDANGSLTFDPPMRTSQLTITFTPPPPQQNVNTYTGVQTNLPIGVGELIVRPALAPNGLLDLNQAVELPCGSGPTLSAGDRLIQTRLTGTRRDLQELREMVAQPCGSGASGLIRLDAGEQRIIVEPSTLSLPSRLSLDPSGSTPSAVSNPVRVDTWTTTVRAVHVNPEPTARVIAVRENTNLGWRATVDGHVLQSVVLDGWQQGWLVPAGVGGEIELRYTPDTTYRVGLLIGAMLLLILTVLALVPARHGAHARGPAWAPARRTDRLAALAIGAAGLILVGGYGGILVAVAGVIAAFYRTLFPRPRAAINRSLLRAVELWVPVGLLALGGYLALSGGYDEHTTFGPQVAGLLAVCVLWLSVVLQPSALTRRELQQRPLKQVVAQRRQQKRAREAAEESRE
jgi:arabinofuranan 3-O-arabinosyltransferase